MARMSDETRRGGSLKGEGATRIALLPEVVRNQIAAGEVIERPASVVKELVENSLDAGATRIQVDLEEGGSKLVRVTDDGIGMGKSDLELAFVPHATSKLREVADLDHISSLGFRGEALASMGAIARCSILSREEGAELGWRIENEGGRIRGPVESGCPKGTAIEIRDLFFNTPARRQFLKRKETELGRCLDLIQRAALSHEGVSFVVTHGKNRVFDVESSMDLLARIRRTFGAELAEGLVPVEARDGDLTLHGYVAPPRYSRRDTTRQMFFLNGRNLRDKILIRALKDSYRGFLVDGRQPVAFLSLSMDPAQVDVNVHPTKTEVRFRDPGRVIGFLVHHLRDAVRSTDMSTPGESMIETMRRRETRQGGLHGSLFPSSSDSSSPVRGGSSTGFTDVPRSGGARESIEVYEVPGKAFEPGTPAASSPPTGPNEDTISPTAPVLQVARTFLIREIHDEQGGFEIIDQHALHERINFEALKKEVEEGEVEMQRFLVPEVVTVSRDEIQKISPHLESLKTIGIEVEVFGEDSLAVHGVPVRLRRPEPESLVREILRSLSSTGKAPTIRDVLEEVLHSAACRSSVMAGDELTQEEIRSLLASGIHGETDQTCPHARPTRVRFTLADLEKAFHRR